MRDLAQRYLRGLYQRTMDEAYGWAFNEVQKSVDGDGLLLDCGAGSGWSFHKLNETAALDKKRYFGIEWNSSEVQAARSQGLNVIRGDLNRPLPYQDSQFDCVMGLSVLEHLLNGCHWILECKRVLKPGGKLVILTPNISTYFTVALLLLGKMPSSGPHPDSMLLMKTEKTLSVASHMDNVEPDVEQDTPMHRHLVVFSYRALNKYMHLAGFSTVGGKGFGLYPFPNFAQPLLEAIDKVHCHQMVFAAKK
ncbi:MAG TPA: class I SAM-dependent methyltransferase [Candidatus Binatia bacterium]